MNKLIALLILIVLTHHSCIQDDRSYENKQTYKLINQFAKKMKCKDLIDIGIGCAERDGKTTKFSAVFLAEEILNRNDARKLIVASANKFLEILNNTDENYFFSKIPADLSMIDIGIIGKSPEHPNQNFLFSVSVHNGTIYYKYDNTSSKIKNLISHEEAFEEAERILEENGDQKESC